MALFLEFLSQQWMLATALLVLLAMLFFHESRKGAKAVSPQELSNLVNKEDAVVLDIRDSAEFKKGHIINAISMPHGQVATRMSELEKYKQKPVILVCKMGQHSGMVSKQLKAAGFEQLFKLGGGLAEWQQSQLPLVKG